MLNDAYSLRVKLEEYEVPKVLMDIVFIFETELGIVKVLLDGYELVKLLVLVNEYELRRELKEPLEKIEE